MKRTIIASFFICLLYSSVSTAQTFESATIYDHMDYLRRESIIFNSNQKAYENIDGTPYLNREFKEGKVFLKSGDVLTGDFRFDLYANHVQFIDKGSRYVIAYPEKIYKIELDGNVFKYIDYRIDAGIDEGYFIELVDGYYSLYLKKSKTLKDPVATKPYQQARPARFVDHRDYYYIKIGEDPAKRVRNKRELIRLSGEYGPEVESYIKENKIRLSREFDLVKLVDYINNELINELGSK